MGWGQGPGYRAAENERRVELAESAEKKLKRADGRATFEKLFSASTSAFSSGRGEEEVSSRRILRAPPSFSDSRHS